MNSFCFSFNCSACWIYSGLLTFQLTLLTSGLCHELQNAKAIETKVSNCLNNKWRPNLNIFSSCVQYYIAQLSIETPHKRREEIALKIKRDFNYLYISFYFHFDRNERHFSLAIFYFAFRNFLPFFYALTFYRLGLSFIRFPSRWWSHFVSFETKLDTYIYCHTTILSIILLHSIFEIHSITAINVLLVLRKNKCCYQTKKVIKNNFHIALKQNSFRFQNVCDNNTLSRKQKQKKIIVHW